MLRITPCGLVAALLLLSGMFAANQAGAASRSPKTDAASSDGTEPADAASGTKGSPEKSAPAISSSSGTSSRESDEGRPPGGRRRFVIGISPFLDPAAKNEAFRQVVRFLLEDMPLDSSLAVYDAYRMRTIARMEVPNVRAFASGKTRANQFKDGILAVKRFLATDQERPSAEGLDFDGVVRLPQFLDFVGDHLVEAGGRLDVAVLGSPLYVDEKEPGFSMVRGYFPSDGHLLAARERSVFGLKDRDDRLHGVVVHLGYFGDPWSSELHQERIGRFWALFIEGQGGSLASLAGDLPTVFASLRGGSDAPQARPPHGEINRSDEKVEMRRITRDVGAADWITRERGELTNLAQGPPTKTVGPMKIGIRWQGDIDLDLYARPRQQGERLYFEHTRIPEGYYYKDHRSSPDREYEFIEFEAPVDVRQVEAAVNFYDGTMPAGTGGEIRIEFDGRVYDGHFTIGANHGNRGREGSGQSSFWAPIDVSSLLRLH